ncbi:MAG: hypothetical protein KatS3mg129_0584 [Leptospiraceae bacterium]|nr:MAG: hypothetical protein KatS3mg129_0584 [Leptospiraceae bacterium]
MEIINIIIDSVDDILIFNLIESRFPSRYLHYKNKISKEFINEFIKEIVNLNHFILSLDNLDYDTSLKTINKLKIISETFFVQFFPEEIIDKFRISDGGYLFFHIDSNLAHIPWEILYDGKSFLGDKFRIGRSIDGTWREKAKLDKSKLKVLILVNPTMDLEEAEEEGTILFETLNTEISNDLLEIQMYAGNRITKFKFLSEIQNYDIVHYAGHVVYNEQYPEGGILLTNNEVLSSKEIEKLPNTPYLVFLNACRSAVKESNIGLANAFLKAGVPNYIGTNWNIPDSYKTVEFAINFYRHLFDEKSIGDAIFEARKYARETHELHELIWASYSLHGNPITKIFRYPERRSFEAIRTDWNLKKVFNEYPTFIAVPYKNFTLNKNKFYLLIEAFKHFILSINAIIIETYNKFNLKLTDLFEEEVFPKDSFYEKLVNKEDFSDIKLNELVQYCYLCAKRLNLLNIQIQIMPIIKSFLLHKDDIEKMLDLVEELNISKENNTHNKNLELSNEEIETFIVSFQYLLENLFIDFSIISKINFFYNNGIHFPSILFKGEKEKPFHVLPIFKEDIQLKKFLEENIGSVCIIYMDFYLSLKNYIEYEPISKKFIFKVQL